MAEPRSALDPGRGVQVEELRGLRIQELATWPDRMDEVRVAFASGPCPLPEQPGTASRRDERQILWIAPERLLLVAPDGALEDVATALAESGAAAVSDVSDGRAILRLSGSNVRALLAKGLPIDLHRTAFPEDTVARSAIHQMNVLVHRTGDAFMLHVHRSFAQCFSEWLLDAAGSPE